MAAAAEVDPEPMRKAMTKTDKDRKTLKLRKGSEKLFGVLAEGVQSAKCDVYYNGDVKKFGYIYYKGDKGYRLTSGWEEFRKEHKLEVGDFIIFWKENDRINIRFEKVDREVQSISNLTKAASAAAAAASAAVGNVCHESRAVADSVRSPEARALAESIEAAAALAVASEEATAALIAAIAEQSGAASQAEKAVEVAAEKAVEDDAEKAVLVEAQVEAENAPVAPELNRLTGDGGIESYDNLFDGMEKTEAAEVVIQEEGEGIVAGLQDLGKFEDTENVLKDIP